MTGGPGHRLALAAALVALAIAAAACGSTPATATPPAAATPAPTTLVATFPPGSPPPASAPAASQPAAGSPVPTAPPAPTASPAPSASPSSAPSASPSPTPNPNADPAAGVVLGAPYTLGKVDASTASTIKGVLRGSMGAATYAKVHIGLREVKRGGAAAAYLMVVRFKPGTLTDAAYLALLHQMQVNSKVTLKTSTVAGVPFTTSRILSVYLGGYHRGDDAIMVIAPIASKVIPLGEALIAANP